MPASMEPGWKSGSDASRFLRLNRSTIVNLDRVREVWQRPNDTHEVRLAAPRPSASRRRGDELRRAIARLE